MDHSNDVSAWLNVMCNAEFFEPCKTHSNVKKNDLNFFCIDCLCSMCSHCLQHHLQHQYIQVRKYMYKDVINVQDLRKLFSCTGIQTYQTNKAKVILIKKKPSSQQQSSTTSYSCVNCTRNLQDPTLYCSIFCKVAAICSNNAAVMFDENGESRDEEIAREKEKEKGSNSRKRKGSPVRAPQF